MHRRQEQMLLRLRRTKQEDMNIGRARSILDMAASLRDNPSTQQQFIKACIADLPKGYDECRKRLQAVLRKRNQTTNETAIKL